MFYSPSLESNPVIDATQEATVFAAIADAMTAHNRKEKLIRYSPTSSSSIDVVFAYFRQADIVIGPRGSSSCSLCVLCLNDFSLSLQVLA